MKAFLALMFCKPQDVRTYALEVRTAIKSVAGDRMKYGEGGAGMTAIAFKSDLPVADVCKAFLPLWRAEQRTWVMSLEEQCLIDKALMTWAHSEPWA